MTNGKTACNLTIECRLSTQTGNTHARLILEYLSKPPPPHGHPSTCLGKLSGHCFCYRTWETRGGSHQSFCGVVLYCTMAGELLESTEIVKMSYQGVTSAGMSSFTGRSIMGWEGCVPTKSSCCVWNSFNFNQLPGELQHYNTVHRRFYFEKDIKIKEPHLLKVYLKRLVQQSA